MRLDAAIFDVGTCVDLQIDRPTYSSRTNGFTVRTKSCGGEGFSFASPVLSKGSEDFRYAVK